MYGATTLSSPSLKRHAHDSPPYRGSPGKRLKPNLAHGFSGLSLSAGLVPPLPPSDDSSESADSTHDTDLDIEEIETPSSPSSIGTADSDATFRLQRRRTKRRPMQADEVVTPDEVNTQINLDQKDTFTNSPPLNRKRRIDEDQLEAKRRRVADRDVSMDEGEFLHGNAHGWYEPEKDRIIVTSLDSPQSSRTSSGTSSPSHDQAFSQPGAQGFTLNASLLTHLLNAQRDKIHSVPLGQRREQGLVLYRPVRNFPIETTWDPMQDNSDRFEEVDDDVGEAMEVE